MKTIDFASLSPRDALDLAILIEEEAAERYGELADQMVTHHTAAAAEFFRVMVANETRHRDELAARRKARFGDVAASVDWSMLTEVEAPEYDSVRAFMTRRQALEVALASEEKAYRFFVDAIPHLDDPEARALFEELRDEELVHQKLVRNEIAGCADEGQFDTDFADDPVAQ